VEEAGGGRGGKRLAGGSTLGPRPARPDETVNVTEAYLADLTLDSLRLLAVQLVVDIDPAAIEDREELLQLLRSNSL